MAFSETLPNLPVIPDISCGTSTGATTLVPAGGKLQEVLNAANPGDTIQLQAGATFVGPITLPVKSGSGCITIRTSAPDSALPPAGERISPTYASVLPKIVSPGLNQHALKTAYGAHHYKIIGVEITKKDEAAFVSQLVEFGDGLMTSLAQVPHHIELDRVYVHGLPNSHLKFCVLLNSAATTVMNSHISDCKIVGFDSQAIGGWSGPGPFRIINNFLEGAGENVMFGGADPRIPNLVPSDIEIRGNLISKPLTWKISDPSYAGTPWQVKNLLELKNARRVLIDGNIFEYSWVHAQVGYGIMLTVRNQSNTAPWSVTEDITFTNNIIRYTANGIGLSGLDSNYTSQPTRRVLIKNNLFLDIGNAKWGGGGRLFQLSNGPADVTIENNTAFQTSQVVYAAGALPASNFIFRNNIMPHNTYGVFGDGAGIGFATLGKYFPGYQFVKNVLIKNAFTANYPSDNFNAATIEAVGFTNIGADDYSLSPTSPYNNAGTNGADIGVDWAKLQGAAKNIAPITQTAPKTSNSSPGVVQPPANLTAK
jgi:hypothetical protein